VVKWRVTLGKEADKPMRTKRLLLIPLILIIGGLGCYTISGVARLSTEQSVDSLAMLSEAFERDLQYDQLLQSAGVLCEPEWASALSEYSDRFVQATANLLSAPEAQTYELEELQGIVERAVKRGSVEFIAEQDGDVLANVFLPRCTMASREPHGQYYIYVFARTGEYWDTGLGKIVETPIWEEDRWLLLADPPLVISYPHELNFYHVKREGKIWSGVKFDDLVGPYYRRLELIDGYRTLSFHFRVPHFDPPCDLHLEDGMSFSATLIDESFTYGWTGDDYYLISEAAGVNSIVVEIASKKKPQFVEAWQDYCLVQSQ
jgi:hypothetical protein